MTTNDAQMIVAALRNGSGYDLLPMLLMIAFAGLAAYFGSYLRERGKNAATKDDVTALTEAVEMVEHKFSSELERLRATNVLRSAAIDKRLQTHQEAYRLWYDLLGAVHESQIRDVCRNCREWWVNNCLYLSPGARAAFQAAYSAASHHHYYLTPGRDPKEAELNWQKITVAGDAIVEGVDLPAAGEKEFVSEMKKDLSRHQTS